ncbi:MAG: exodeoxyribonuclease VII large subunit [Rickettsiales bacterium]
MSAFNHNQPERSVSEITGQVKELIEEQFGHVRVRGEIGRVTFHQNGHCYITLKDDQAVLDAVCWRGNLSRLQHKPEMGMDVIVTGKLSAYAKGKSSYQLIIESLELAGIGALMAMLEQRKKQFAAEGLFDASRKQPLPFLPEVIGIVTSPTGAVIRDILHRLADRFPRHVLLWPVPVQGAGAAEKIAEAIAGFNTIEGGLTPPSQPTDATPAAGGSPSATHDKFQGLRRPDLIIVARGGGSVEDLWCFNEEVVVRAVAASRIPVISAVGHETDTTLIDYVADKRAPTPTAAAELAVPVRSELLARLESLQRTQTTAMQKMLHFHGERIEGLARGLPRPTQLVAGMAQMLDSIGERLSGALPRLVARKADMLKRAEAGLSPRYLRQLLEGQQQRLAHASTLLESLNVLAVLKRGFVLVKDSAGQVLKTADAVSTGAELRLQFHDGEKQVVAGGAKTKKPAAKPAGQAGLFDDAV